MTDDTKTHTMDTALPSSLPPHLTLDCSHAYLSPQRLRSLIDSHAHPLHALVMTRSVLTKTSDSQSVLEALNTLLHQHASTLQSVNCAGSNVSGRIFYRGREFPVVDPAEEHVTVEATAHVASVRDDNPLLFFDDGAVRYHYVRTVLSSEAAFTRYYVILDWLPRLSFVDMSGTLISGHGLTSLAAAAGSSIQILRVGSCAEVDDQGLRSVAQLCKALRGIDVSHCGNVTEHGLLYLSEMPSEQLRKLQWLNMAGTATTPLATTSGDATELVPLATAMLHALEDGGFRGLLVTDSGTRGNLVKVYGHPEAHQVRAAYDTRPNTITDLCGNDITKDVLSLFIPCRAEGCFHDATCPRHPQPKADNPEAKPIQAYSIDLSDRFVNNMVLELVLSRWGRRLASLHISGTFITERGLEHLQRCPNLRILHMGRCKGITSKSGANRIAMPCIARMTRLKEVVLSDSRISGRLFSDHPDLQLACLKAARCPISVHAVRMLSDLCASSMTWLNLAGCSYLNARSIHYLAKFTNLYTLVLSQCSGLTKEDVMRFADTTASKASLQRFDVSGIVGMDAVAVRAMEAALRGASGQPREGVVILDAAVVAPTEAPVTHAYAVMPLKAKDPETTTPAAEVDVDSYMMMAAGQLQTPTQRKHKPMHERTKSDEPGRDGMDEEEVDRKEEDEAALYTVFADTDVDAAQRKEQQSMLDRRVRVPLPKGAAPAAAMLKDDASALYSAFDSVDLDGAAPAAAAVLEPGTDAAAAAYLLLPGDS